MATENLLNRRSALVLAGAAGLGILTASPASAQPKFERLEKAIEEMKAAKEQLDKGTGFGGHKKKAISALETAIAELEAAIEFAKGKKK